MSFVEVSPSTVSWLKVRRTTRDHVRAQPACSTIASVSTNANMVAMFGWIIPSPWPRPRRARRRAAHLGRLGHQVGGQDRLGERPDVVAERRDRERDAALDGVERQPAPDDAGGRGEHVLRAVELEPGAPAAAMSSLSQTPASPVAQLALPAFTTSARTGCLRKRRGRGCAPRRAP
jgi:hypothetical protein